MNQGEKSQRSREQILEAALQLFSTRGFAATSVRDIATTARLSTGNVYHHFPDKETIFQSLLDDYWEAMESPEFPFNKALATGTFPENIEAIGKASRESVELYRRYVALIYVDVVEFEGVHIRKFYTEMAKRFADFLQRHDRSQFEAHLRDGVSPVSAVMLVGRFFLHFFSVEVLFGVPNHFGKDSDAAIAEIADILRHGLLRREGGS
jgi:AcrR family transcriptional regulator